MLAVGTFKRAAVMIRHVGLNAGKLHFRAALGARRLNNRI